MASVTQLIAKFNRIRGRRVFIVPTRFGLLYAAFLLLILLAAINYSNSLGHILCFLLGSMGILAMHYTYNNLAKLELINAYAEPVFAGQYINFTLLFDNSGKAPCYQIDVASKQDLSAQSRNPLKNLTGYHFYRHSTIDAIAINSHHQHCISISSKKRGQQKLGRIRIASHYPFGLFETWSYFDTDYTALVYPKPISHLPLPSPTEQGQDTIGRLQNGLDDFSGFNRYRSGDAIHAIAWKAAARDDVLRTKQFTSATSGRILLSWHDTVSLNDDEQRLSQLCRWLLDVEHSNRSYALDLPTQTIDYGHGSVHQQRCLKALALYDAA